MAYCGPLGIPHSEFCSWEHADQDKAIAWLGFEKGKCPGCNTFPEEYLDKEKRMISPPPYMVYSEICYGCAQIHDMQEEIGTKNLAGISLRMVPNPNFKDPDE